MMSDMVMRGLASKSNPLMGRERRQSGSVWVFVSRTTSIKEMDGCNFGHKSCTSGMMDQKDRKNMGTLRTSGESHRDESPVHRSSNPMTNRSHVNFIIRGPMG